MTDQERWRVADGIATRHPYTVDQVYQVLLRTKDDAPGAEQILIFATAYGYGDPAYYQEDVYNMPKQRPGRKPTDDPKRTARLIVQVFPAEYDQVVTDAHTAGYNNYADYIRARLNLTAVHRPTLQEGS